jgi:hypothetical protein
MTNGDYDTLDLAGVLRGLGLSCKEAREVGKYYIECPWEHEHSQKGNGTDTVIWQNGEGWPSFHCSHAIVQGARYKT